MTNESPTPATPNSEVFISYASQDEARTAKRGLWSLPRDERIAPWEYRKRKSRESFTDYSAETAKLCIAVLGKR